MKKSNVFFEGTEKDKDINARSIKNSLKVSVSSESTYVIMVAFHEDSGKNYLHPIKYDDGIPISGHLYDTQSKCYYVECCGVLHLGIIPVSFRMEMANVSNWNIRIPLSEPVIKKHLSTQQRKDYKKFRDSYKENYYSFKYLQMINCY